MGTNFNYLKKGDRCSNLVNSVTYTKNNICEDVIKYVYDQKGNITNILKNGKETVRYTYDDLSRLIREDNKDLEKTYLFFYDQGGNILRKEEYNYSTKPAEFLENAIDEKVYNYASTGWKDKLMAYNGLEFKYDSLGNPEEYMGNTLKWNYLRQLEKYNNKIFIEKSQQLKLLAFSISQS